MGETLNNEMSDVYYQENAFVPYHEHKKGYETFAIASAIIGGTSFFGGRGQIPTVVIGGLIIGTISNGLNMLGVSSYYQQIVTGSLIIIAVFLDRIFKGKASK